MSRLSEEYSESDSFKFNSSPSDKSYKSFNFFKRVIVGSLYAARSSLKRVTGVFLELVSYFKEGHFIFAFLPKRSAQKFEITSDH
jgi:hypothetical protein